MIVVVLVIWLLGTWVTKYSLEEMAVFTPLAVVAVGGPAGTKFATRRLLASQLRLMVAEPVWNHLQRNAQRVELQETGVLNGDLKAGTLTVAAGSRMRGRSEFGWGDELSTSKPALKLGTGTLS